MERAINVFEEMQRAGKRPTDVTVNSLVDACARRPEYYQEAKRLIREMREFGFEPDRYTRNVMIYAAAKKGDLKEALEVYSGTEKGEIETTNLLFAYGASHFPRRHASSSKVVEGMPRFLDEALQQVDCLFEASSKSARITNAYLGVYVAQKQYSRACEIYEKCEPNEWTHQLMLQASVDAGDVVGIWDAWKKSRKDFNCRRYLQKAQRKGLIGNGVDALVKQQ